MGISVRVSAPIPIWGELPTTENAARFHERWNKGGTSYAKMAPARWIEMACTAPLLATRIALKAGMIPEVKGAMMDVHVAMQEDFKGRVVEVLTERSQDYERLHPGFVGTFNLEKSVTDRLSAEVLADARWRQEYAALERRLRDWLMDNQAEAGMWLDKSMAVPPVTVATLSFPG